MGKFFYKIRRGLYIIPLLFMGNTTGTQAANGVFHLGTQGVTDISVKKTFSQSDSITPFSVGSRLKSLAITGKVTRKGQDYLVRVLLKDAQGKEYLVMESYYGMDDEEVINLKNYGQETLLLNNVQPTSIKIFVKNAEFQLDDINVQAANNVLMQPISENAIKELRQRQAEAVADKINTYNTTHDKLWRAGVTTLSLMSYEQRRNVLGASDDAQSYGYEYYNDGIFEIGDPLDNKTASTEKSTYIDHFDWRNRHGKNWITPEKDQGESGYCSAFATVGATEAMANLYYNRSLNLDLSEQKVACCSDSNPELVYKKGLRCPTALSYLEFVGTYDEESYPFEDSPSYCKSDKITPKMTVSINGYNFVGRDATDKIKEALIKKGPLVSVISSPNFIHALSLVGYKVLEAGDTAYLINDQAKYDGYHIVKEDDKRIGMTCWIFKDSYANSHYYFPVIFHNIKGLSETWAIK